MNTVTITVPDGPVITVHKGWSISKKRIDNRKEKHHSSPDQRQFETNTFPLPSKPSQNGKSSASNPPEEEIILPIIDPDILTTRPPRQRGVGGQQIEFVNATKPAYNRDAGVRKQVRSHVMREIARGRRERKREELREKDGARTKDADATASAKARARIEARDAAAVASAEEETPPFLAAQASSSRPPQPVNSSTSKSSSSSLSSSSQQTTASSPSPFFPLAPHLHYHFPYFPSSATIPPSTHHLVTVYFTQLASAMFPMEFHLAYNPMKQVSLVEFSMSDDAVFHALLFAAAVCERLATAEGRGWGRDTVGVQMGRTIGLVNRRLEAGVGMGDAVLGAVSCLAMGEALQGHFSSWAVHMAGLKKMVEMRGGMENINLMLQLKLYRADLMGSVDQVTPPFFPYNYTHRPTLYTNPFLPSLPFHSPLLVLPLLPTQLSALLGELQDFSSVIEQTLLVPGGVLDPKEWIEACYSIQYQLLPSASANSGEWASNRGDELEMSTTRNIEEEAFRLGGILFMKEILQEFTFSAMGSRIVVTKLKIALDVIFANQASITSGRAPAESKLESDLELESLLLWLLMVGGMASVKRSLDRSWFVAHLVRVSGVMGLGLGLGREGWQGWEGVSREGWEDVSQEEWEDVKRMLGRVVWCGGVLDEAGRGLWEEVVVTRGVLGVGGG